MAEGVTPEQWTSAVRALVPQVLGYLSAWLCFGALAGGFLFSLGALAAWMVVKMLLTLLGATL